MLTIKFLCVTWREDYLEHHFETKINQMHMISENILNDISENNI